ncbi:FAD-dependent oxidoreductase [Streptosporangium longisporum]|uniref:FAD-dependent oxidoreductase n=1 Tax=Streptosporangium longisporum TaxID=46187 RepID=A0ABN3YEU3_9ACTN
MNKVDVDVLVVGGGPVGLSTAVELARHGISVLLVERRPDTSAFPKARLITTRTMEILRGWGVHDEVERTGMPREEYLAVGVGSSLTADDFVRSAAELERDAPQSPTYTFLCAQDRLEVILRRLAESRPEADVWFGATMTGMSATADGVTATVRRTGDGTTPGTGDGTTAGGGTATGTSTTAGGETVVRCRYLVAADGSRSGVREDLGIAVEGPPPLGHMISIMFEADLGFLPPDRRAALSFLSDPPCAVEAVDHERRWMVQTGYEPELGGSPADFTEEVCLAAVRAAVGVPDLPVTVLGVMPWLQQAKVATAFRAGPVFLAGDAAHVATPQGGFGMNCGIQDAHNLAWKLAAVLRGTAGEELLDTYEAERRPVAVRTVDESLNNALITFAMMEGRLSMREAIERQAGRRSCEGLVLGFGYDSGAVLPDGTAPPRTRRPVPDLRPHGPARAPGPARVAARSARTRLDAGPARPALHAARPRGRRLARGGHGDGPPHRCPAHRRGDLGRRRPGHRRPEHRHHGGRRLPSPGPARLPHLGQGVRARSRRRRPRPPGRSRRLALPGWPGLGADAHRGPRPDPVQALTR